MKRTFDHSESQANKSGLDLVNTDVIRLILTKLDMTSLCRFKQTCTRVNFIANQDTFYRMYAANQKKRLQKRIDSLCIRVYRAINPKKEYVFPDDGYRLHKFVRVKKRSFWLPHFCNWLFFALEQYLLPLVDKEYPLIAVMLVWCQRRDLVERFLQLPDDRMQMSPLLKKYMVLAAAFTDNLEWFQWCNQNIPGPANSIRKSDRRKVCCDLAKAGHALLTVHFLDPDHIVDAIDQAAKNDRHDVLYNIARHIDENKLQNPKTARREHQPGELDYLAQNSSVICALIKYGYMIFPFSPRVFRIMIRQGAMREYMTKCCWVSDIPNMVEHVVRMMDTLSVFDFASNYRWWILRELNILSGCVQTQDDAIMAQEIVKCQISTEIIPKMSNEKDRNYSRKFVKGVASLFPTYQLDWVTSPHAKEVVMVEALAETKLFIPLDGWMHKLLLKL